MKIRPLHAGSGSASASVSASALASASVSVSASASASALALGTIAALFVVAAAVGCAAPAHYRTGLPSETGATTVAAAEARMDRATKVDLLGEKLEVLSPSVPPTDGKEAARAGGGIVPPPPPIAFSPPKKGKGKVAPKVHHGGGGGGRGGRAGTMSFESAYEDEEYEAKRPEPAPTVAPRPMDAGEATTAEASKGARFRPLSGLKRLFAKKSVSAAPAAAGAPAKDEAAGPEGGAAYASVDKADEDRDGLDDGAGGSAGAGGAGVEPKVRKDFPEALLFAPEIVTSDGGTAKVDVPLADTVTDWRMTALASTADGRFGDGEGSLHVFQPFFINVFAPRTLEQGDSATLQVGVFNYLSEPRKVKVEVTRAPWFEPLSSLSGELDVPAGGAAALPVTIRVGRDGVWPLRVSAKSADLADAVEVPLTVEPGGVAWSTGGIVPVVGEKTFSLALPAAALAAGRAVDLRVYGGEAATLEGDLESFLAQPNGCLEQTLSRMEANLAALEYLESTGAGAGPLADKARHNLRDGYFKLLTHRTAGAFALYPGKVGGDEYEAYLGVRALELLRTAATHKGVTIDPDLVTALEAWARARYLATLGAPSVVVYGDDGRPKPSGGPVGLAAAVARALRFALPAAGRARLADALPGAPAYTVALVASYARRTGDADLYAKAVERLRALATVTDEGAHWTAGERTFASAYDADADIEATALAASELLGAPAPGAAPGDAELGGKAVAWLLARRAPGGGWGTTSSSARAVEAVAALARGGKGAAAARGDVVVWLGATPVVRAKMPAWGEVVSLDLTDKLPVAASSGAGTKVRVTVAGAARAELAVHYRLPYSEALRAALPSYSLDVSYGDLEVKTGEVIPVRVRAARTAAVAGVNPAVIHVPVAGTMEVDERGLEDLVRVEAIDRFERDATGVTLYVDDVDASGVDLSFAVRAVFAGEATTGVAEVYEYYHPAARGLGAPATLRSVSDLPK
ncbi:MAG TPA: alpha-2-macroglobulin family protein [Myxococcota bacterium]|jgi:hypothetical protein|nr:alpha-2-macroglobulin family protein [Myxococcota bacterium]